MPSFESKKQKTVSKAREILYICPVIKYVNPTNKQMEFETFKTIVWFVTVLSCSAIVGWAVADYVKFVRNLKNPGK